MAAGTGGFVGGDDDDDDDDDDLNISPTETGLSRVGGARRFRSSPWTTTRRSRVSIRRWWRGVMREETYGVYIVPSL